MSESNERFFQYMLIGLTLIVVFAVSTAKAAEKIVTIPLGSKGAADVRETSGRELLNIELFNEIKKQVPDIVAAGLDLRSVRVDAKASVGGAQLMLQVKTGSGQSYVDSRRVETDPVAFKGVEGWKEFELLNRERTITGLYLVGINPLRVRNIRVVLGVPDPVEVKGDYGDVVAEKPKAEQPAQKPAEEQVAQIPAEKPVQKPKVEKPVEKPKANPTAEKPAEDQTAQVPATEKPVEKPKVEQPAEKTAVVETTEKPVDPAVVVIPALKPKPKVEKPAEEKPVVAKPAEKPVRVTPQPEEEPQIAIPAKRPRETKQETQTKRRQQESTPSVIKVAPGRRQQQQPEKRRQQPKLKCIGSICVGRSVVQARTNWDGTVVGIDEARGRVIVRFGSGQEWFNASVSAYDLELLP